MNNVSQPFIVPEALVAGEHTFLELKVEKAEPAVVLVLDGFDPERIFAGVKTALIAGLQVARRLARPLRIVPVRAVGEGTDATLRAWVADNAPQDLQRVETSVLPGRSVSASSFDPTDVWIVTYWSTAHAVAAACERGTLSPKQVIYLVQDYEPGFFAWGSTYALAAETYRAGFHLVVNSQPLANVLARQAGVDIEPDNVFGPDLDRMRLDEVARMWRPGRAGEVRVMFYGRPSKPRNMFSLGLAALQQWIEILPKEIKPVIFSAGESHPQVDLGSACVVEPLGKLSLDGYYSLLARVDIGFALMHSPHPGHPSLELPMSGIPTVTNTFQGFRSAWVDGLILGRPTARGLAAALEEAHRRSTCLTRHKPAEVVHDLGQPLGKVLESVIGRITW